MFDKIFITGFLMALVLAIVTANCVWPAVRHFQLTKAD